MRLTASEDGEVDQDHGVPACLLGDREIPLGIDRHTLRIHDNEAHGAEDKHRDTQEPQENAMTGTRVHETREESNDS